MLTALLALALAAPPLIAPAGAEGADDNAFADVAPGTVVSDPAGDDVVIPLAPPT